MKVPLPLIIGAAAVIAAVVYAVFPLSYIMITTTEKILNLQCPATLPVGYQFCNQSTVDKQALIIDAVFLVLLGGIGIMLWMHADMVDYVKENTV